MRYADDERFPPLQFPTLSVIFYPHSIEMRTTQPMWAEEWKLHIVESVALISIESYRCTPFHTTFTHGKCSILLSCWIDVRVCVCVLWKLFSITRCWVIEELIAFVLTVSLAFLLSAGLNGLNFVSHDQPSSTNKLCHIFMCACMCPKQEYSS